MIILLSKEEVQMINVLTEKRRHLFDFSYVEFYEPEDCNIHQNQRKHTKYII